MDVWINITLARRLWLQQYRQPISTHQFYCPMSINHNYIINVSKKCTKAKTGAVQFQFENQHLLHFSIQTDPYLTSQLIFKWLILYARSMLRGHALQCRNDQKPFRCQSLYVENNLIDQKRRWIWRVWLVKGVQSQGSQNPLEVRWVSFYSRTYTRMILKK